MRFSWAKFLLADVRWAHRPQSRVLADRTRCGVGDRQGRDRQGRGDVERSTLFARALGRSRRFLALIELRVARMGESQRVWVEGRVR
ncbi:MAG: hypothetical protein LC777_16470 [Actinobacteria bacterium]|nr:hypothetical protein [Actinomycetota bacterium]